MNTIPPIVEELFLNSDVALIAAQEEILNVSAFARKIQPQVAKIAEKDVAEGTITTALSRYLTDFKPPTLKPDVKLDSINISLPVAVFTYDQTPANVMVVSTLSNRYPELNNDLFCITQGRKEITIITSEIHVLHISDLLGKPVEKFSELAAITVTFDKMYLTIPNTLYTIMSALAVKQINIIELLSTTTSLTFVVYEKELNQTLDAVRKFMK